MAELYQAYGFSENESFAPKNDFYEDKHEVEKSMYKEPVHQQQPQQAHEYSQQPQQVQHAQHVQHAQQGQHVQHAQQGHQATRRNPSYSFTDRMSMKRPEVMKLAIFSLVIVLAIAIDRLGTYYISKYLSDNIFTDFQEFMMRLSYPVMIFLLLWIFKSL